MDNLIPIPSPNLDLIPIEYLSLDSNLTLLCEGNMSNVRDLDMLFWPRQTKMKMLLKILDLYVKCLD